MDARHKHDDRHFAFTCSHHARKRMDQRGVSRAAVCMALFYGREVYGKGAKCYVIGRKEIDTFSDQNTNLSSAEGVHVLVSGNSELPSIITVYRNKNLSSIKAFAKRRY